jgi:dihydrofolate reductase
VPVLLDMAVSLDGMVSRADGSVDDGLHDWYFDPTPASTPIVDELVETSGCLGVTSIDEAIARATEAAGARYATIGGGADIARQCLAAGLVDEVQLHVVPVVFGRGLRLFDDSTGGWGLRPTRVVDAPNVTHLRYAVERS